MGIFTILRIQGDFAYMPDQTDQDLVNRVQQGDKKAFNLLVIRYQHKLASLVSRYVISSDVEDIVQETFIKAFRSIKNFRGDSSFYTWVFRIAVNTAKNHLIAQKRKPSSSDTINDEQEDPILNIPDHQSPEDILHKEQLEKIIFTTINNLSDELRLAITLREIEGLSYEEIASIMQCPVGTVRSRIFRARDIIEQKIGHLKN